MITAEPLMTPLERNRSGWRSKYNRTFPGSNLLLVTPLVIRPSFQGLPTGLIALSIKYGTRIGKGLILPSRFSLNGIVFCFLLLSFSFLVCEQLLKGIVYPLTAKVQNVLKLV